MFPRLKVRTGCAGWTIPRQVLSQFPAPGKHLERYSQIFNSSEINSSFYRPHKPETWERWKNSVPDDFQFSVKAPKTITHLAKLVGGREELANFLAQLKPLAKKLGPILFQLPPSLQFDEGRATQFLAMLREFHSGPVAWEPRHESWFHPAADSLLTKFQVARVAADPGCVPAAQIPGGWKGLIYYRLHGSPRRYYSAYTPEFMAQLGEAIAASPAPERWCIFDNTASGAAAGNALELRALLYSKSA